MPTPIKVLVIVIFVLIISALGTALISLIRGKEDDGRMVRALSWRVGLSVALFAMILLLSALGIIEPNR